MITPIVAYATHDKSIPGHVSLYRILPEMAIDEDGRSNVYSFDDLKSLLAQEGLVHSVEMVNDQKMVEMIEEASSVLSDQIGRWTGAINAEKAMFFFEKSSAAVTFKLCA